MRLHLVLSSALAIACSAPSVPTCDTTTCQGCCDAAGACHGGLTADACGANGSTCQPCGSGTTCSAGACTAASTLTAAGLAVTDVAVHIEPARTLAST